MVERVKMFSSDEFRKVFDVIGGHLGSYACVRYFMIQKHDCQTSIRKGDD